MAFIAACVQLCSSTEPAENIEVVQELARRAAREGAQYVQTPEMTNIVQRDRADLFQKIATEQEDRSVAAFSGLARELGIHLHIGSLALQMREDKVANRALVFAPDGGVVARYDKIHLFDVDLPNGESWRESAVYAAGDEAVLAELPWAKLGITICYDLRFPHLYRALAHAGASILAIPAAFTRQSGEAHWHVLQRARAIENGAFVISAAQAGKHADGRETFGHSMIVAPWGEILAEAGGAGPELIMAEVDPRRSEEVRQRIPSLKNEREFASPCASAPRVARAS